MSTNTRSKNKQPADHRYILVSFAAIIGGLLLGNQLAQRATATPDYRTVNGIGLVVVFLAVGFALERLMELWAEVSFIPRFGGQKRKAEAAGDMEKASKIKANTKLLIFAFAAAYGMIISGASRLFLWGFVGVANLPDWLNVLSTGLAIGAGIEPLHKLLVYMERRIESHDD